LKGLNTVPQAEGARMRPAIGQRFLRTSFLFRALFVLLFAQAGLPNNAVAQVIQGHLIDSETRTPVINGSVALRDSLGAVVARTGSDEEGAFSFTAPRPGRYSLLAVGMGYRSAPTGDFEVGAEGEVTIDVHLNPKPIEIPGIDVGGGTFAERLSNVETGLDLRLAQLPGQSQVVTPDRVRLYDTTHAKDPYKLLWREFRVGWDFDMEAIRVRTVMGRKVTPEVYVDDRRTWLINLVLMPNSSLCRVEMYQPPPFMMVETVPFQLRAYTCQFMAHVASGARTMRSHLNWGDLIAGPGG
jgi:hypothetical protein